MYEPVATRNLRHKVCYYRWADGQDLQLNLPQTRRITGKRYGYGEYKVQSQTSSTDVLPAGSLLGRRVSANIDATAAPFSILNSNADQKSA
ncbi:hypothetical protein [Shewanella indica]|uniref:hypothetical protein n=1 Tax=Shewanella indica TaxID=768528 RepID=UPI00399AB25D